MSSSLAGVSGTVGFVVVALALTACGGRPRFIPPADSSVGGSDSHVPDNDQCGSASDECTDAGTTEVRHVPGYEQCGSASDECTDAGATERPTSCSDPNDIAVTSIAAGTFHTCAVTSAGIARCWGSLEIQNEDYMDPRGYVRYEAPGLSGASNVEIIAGGTDQSCALKTDGTIACSATAASATHFRAIAVGSHHVCAVTDTSAVQCWGQSGQGQLGDGSTQSSCLSPSECTRMHLQGHATGDILNGVRAVAAGKYHTCAIMKDTDGVRCWGGNGYGQLGDGTNDQRYTPPTEDTLVCARAIAAGDSHTCALMKNGDVRCWGDNSHGQLGDGTGTTRSTPSATILSGVRAITAGAAHTCALMETGGVRCWGDNGNGQLGIAGDWMPYLLAPPDSDVLTGARAVAAGGAFTCAALDTGGVECWGDNSYGQLHPDELNPSGPTLSGDIEIIPGQLLSARFVTAGGARTCTISEENKLRCWGDNSTGAIGEGTLYDRSSPSNEVLTGVKDVAANESNTCALMETGDVLCWGGGSDTLASTPRSATLTGARVISAGRAGFCGVTTTDTVQCWGYSSSYNWAGDIMTEASSVTVGSYFACALTKSGGVRCWGGSDGLGGGALGGGTPSSELLSGVKAIAAGDAHVCALMIGGGVRCWGGNTSGQLGDGGTIYKPTPPESDVLTDVQAISAGGDHTCALMTSGGVRCWGSVTPNGPRFWSGQPWVTSLRTPPARDALSGVRAIAAGHDHTCALMANGQVRCWGNNSDGQLGTRIASQLIPEPVDGTCR